MTTASTLACEHLWLRLQPINRLLDQAVDRQRQANARLARPELTAVAITEEQLQGLLETVTTLDQADATRRELGQLDAQEIAAERQLRQRAAAIGTTLPLQRLADGLGLTAFEQQAVLLCAAPELDRAYARIYAYILDDMNRRAPCIELLAHLSAGSLHERLSQRSMLGRFGKLRRLGIVQTVGEVATELRQELRLAPGIFDLLSGAVISLENFRDPAEIAVPESIELPPQIDAEAVKRLGKALARQQISAVGVWGPRQSGHQDVVLAIAAATGKSLRQLPLAALQRPGVDLAQPLTAALAAAADLKALLWVAVDPLSAPEQDYLREILVDKLTHCRVAVCFSGVHPWRPAQLLETRNYAELELSAPDYPTRKLLWARAFPALAQTALDDFALRFRLNSPELRAVARVARTRLRLNGNGQAPQTEQTKQIEAACAAVTSGRSSRFAMRVNPQRRPEDLILPSELHAQVMEVANFFRVWAQVDEEWGFGRLNTGNGGIKALFTGDSGTGKTLAADVIANRLGLPLLKVDLAQIVSKWVGETEKNLDAVFGEAEESYSVLFFDEADTLFGRRGEIQSGHDRYANLEVGYLLQRLEQYYGLVILASNLKDQIDNAFTRRFQIVIHFPRPSREERSRIWRISLPDKAPLATDFDFEVLEQLNLTGAGIVSAARTAALLAADDGSDKIGMRHAIQAVVRQYRREDRILSAAELGEYAQLAGDWM